MAQGIPVQSLELQAEADINTTDFGGSGDLQPKTIGFESVRVQADAPHDALLASVRHATLWSPVASNIHNSVHLDATLEAAVVERAG